MKILKKVYRVHFELIDSTNSWAKNNAAFLEQEGLTCIVAEQQTRGKGRYSRRWYSPIGNLYLSLFFSYSEKLPFLPYMSHQVFAVSAAQILQELKIPVRIRWPNDLFLEDKKLGGILTEIFHFEGRVGVVIGIGLNINMTEEQLQKIDQPATSVSNYTKKQCDKELVLNSLLDIFRHNLALLEERGFAPFQDEYNSLLINKPSDQELETCV